MDRWKDVWIKGRKSILTKNLNLNRMNKQTDKRMNGHNLKSTHFFNQWYVDGHKFHHDKTLASLKSNLTKYFNKSGTDRRTD